MHEQTGDVAAAYATAPSSPGGPAADAAPLRRRRAGRQPAGGRPGAAGWTGVAPVGPNHTETSYPDQTLPVTDPPGTAVRFSTPPLTAPVDVVGSPRPAAQLVLFAELYDVGPDGAVDLPSRLVSPVRVADVTRPVTIELPGIVHRFEPGHRLAVVLAGGDTAYRGSTLPQQVALATGPGRVQQLTLPVTSQPARRRRRRAGCRRGTGAPRPAGRRRRPRGRRPRGRRR
ncbi:CocE/NonD family hydrolase C-terminal non-catalytic domain-containing protein [Geodermatophilus sp. SYSU D00525]